MKFHPKNKRVVAKLIDVTESTASGIDLVRVNEKNPVVFVKITEVSPELSGDYYKEGDIVLIAPSVMINTVSWLEDQYLIFPDHQILASVELEKDDNVKGEEFDRENPTVTKIIPIGKPGVC